MVRKKNQSAIKANKRPEPNKYWPWWRINFVNNEQIVLEGRVRVALSPHVVNLRAVNLNDAARALHSQTAVPRTINRAQINFIGSMALNNYAIAQQVNKLQARPSLRDLTVVWLCEIGAWLLDLVWLTSLKFFFQIYEESRVIFYSIWQDVKIYFQTVRRVITYPVNLLAGRSAVNPPPWQMAIKPAAGILKQTLAFLILSLLITLPLKGIATWQEIAQQSNQVIGATGGGFKKLEQASELLARGNPELARQQLISAQNLFSSALTSVNSLSDELALIENLWPVASDKMSAARNVLLASQEITVAASVITRTLTNLQQPTAEPFSLPLKLNILNQATTRLKPHLFMASNYLNQVDEAELPSEYATKLKTIRLQLADLEVSLSGILSLPQLLEQILSSTEPVTYAIIFQNTSELRPSGGFAGSLALIEVGRGEVTSINIPGGGPYDFQGSLASIIRPPEPIRLVRGTWQLQDANWFYDFPSTAQKITWFLKEAGGPAVSGVIAINSNIVVELLKLTGPIELPTYAKVLTADNFMTETQVAVEITYDKVSNRPKQFIADLAPILFTRLLELKDGDIIKLSALLNSGLLRRDIQLYSSDESIQAQFKAYGWAGEVKQTAGDYLAIVRANIGGGKTDKVIREKVTHRVELSPTGELTAHIQLTRTHYGDPRDTFEGRRNVTYLRFYVPLGSTLLGTRGFTPPPANYYKVVPDEAKLDSDLSAIEQEASWDSSSGTRLTTEYNKTVFGNWLSLAPGESKTVELTYRLPWRLNPGTTWQDLRRYSILFQRQSGVAPIDFSSEFSWPDTFRLRWQEASRPTFIEKTSIKLVGDWQTDEYYGLIMEKK